MKKSLLFLMFVSFMSCTMYKTIDVPVNETSLKYYYPKARYWTVQNRSSMPRYVVVNNIESDAIIITPGEVQDKPDHHSFKTTYWRNYGRYERGYFHLTIPTEIVPDTPIRIPFSDIQKAQTHVNDVGATVPLSILTAAGYIAGGGFVVLLVACNCPRVTVMGKGTQTLDGALFPGAMSKALARNDNLLLGRVPAIDGQVQIKISNELPETEYIDRAELFELSNVKYDNVAMDGNGKPVSYASEDLLIAATTTSGVNIQDLISASDQVNYSFDELESDDELNKVILKFKKPSQRQSVLLIKARQSPWVETVGEFFFQQFGTAFPKWVDRLDKTDASRYNQNLRDRGISMNIYIKDNGEWKYVKSFENAGTIAGRELAIPIDINDQNGEVEIKLEAAHGLWDVDRVALTSTWSDDIQIRKLKTLSATNNKQQDVLSLLSSTDGQYLVQPEHTSYVEMKFEAPSSPSSVVMLGGDGYYHHTRHYKSKPNFKLLKEFDAENISTHRLSRLMKAMVASNAPQK